MMQYRFLAILLFTAILVFTACGGSGGGGGDDGGGDGDELFAGDTETYTIDGTSFVMVYVPGDLTCPTGVNDEGTATVNNAYWIGETEVTYALWITVYAWATSGSGATGAGQYIFANAGIQGDNGSRGVQHPVTTVNWRDSMVWCNALTEWYNAKKGADYTCVYTYSGAIIRDSRDGNSTACNGVVESTTAKGFRLLSTNEFELAARYRDGTNWTYGDHVSGDDSGACNDDGAILGGLGMSTVFGDYAVYYSNSGSSTAAVKSKTNKYNALGLYDMSGNVYEWTSALNGSGPSRMYRGGGWSSYASSLQVGHAGGAAAPDLEHNTIGFRIAKTR